jgi:hypothetical protein
MSGSLPQFGGAIGGNRFGGAAPTAAKILGIIERELVFARRERASASTMSFGLWAEPRGDPGQQALTRSDWGLRRPDAPRAWLAPSCERFDAMLSLPNCSCRMSAHDQALR